MRLLLPALLLTASLAACSTKPPVGDANGGIIDWFYSSRTQVQEEVDKHCARYGKTGRIIKTDSDKEGGHAIFSCT